MRKVVTPWPHGRYKLTTDAYMGRIPGAEHERLSAGTVVVWDGLPGPHMEPLDEQAKKNVEHADKLRGGPAVLDPTAHLSLVMGDVDNIDSELAQLNARMAALKAARAEAAATNPASATVAPEPPAAVAAPAPAPLKAPPPPSRAA